MPNINLTGSDGDLGNRYITKDYLMSVYPQIAGQLITPELWGWGRGDSGQLGDNASFDRLTPVTTLAGGANWKQLSCGNARTLAIKTDGTLWTWGLNNGGQLGDNTLGLNKPTPVTTFAGGTNWKQVDAGNNAAAAVKTDGTLWTWGIGTSGQLGDNTIITKSIPVQVFGSATNWKQVSSGGFNTTAIKTDGTLWTWGLNTNGPIGDNTSGTNRLTPVTTFLGGTNWKQVSVGRTHTVAIKTDGTLWTWGGNVRGQLGNNTTNDRLTPVTTFAGGTDWKQVSAGGYFTAAIRTNGTLWVWGWNYRGQLGNNTAPSSPNSALIPITTFAGGTNWKQVDCGLDHTTAIKTDGTLWTWGYNSNAQLGDNTQNIRSIPATTFAGGTNWKQVSGGETHSLAIKTSDDLQGI